MLAISQDKLGGPDVLKVVEVDRPEPGIGQILVRVHVAGVNPVDAMNRQTGYLVGKPLFILGWDVSGPVEAVGAGVTLYRPGDEVFGMLPFPHGHGAYAEYVVGPTRAFVPKPPKLDHAHAAALPLAGLTAWQALVETAHIGMGSRVLTPHMLGNFDLHIDGGTASSRTICFKPNGARRRGEAGAVLRELVRGRLSPYP
jgi:NADPH:quinone reductase-like Zn-dependent oxidoreductase